MNSPSRIEATLMGQNELKRQAIQQEIFVNEFSKKFSNLDKKMKADRAKNSFFARLCNLFCPCDTNSK